MKKLLMILPCVIALSGCDDVKFHENHVKCLSDASDGGWAEYGSLNINSKRAVFKTKEGKIVMNRYILDDFPDDDILLYKNETNEFMPQYLRFVDKEHYTIGSDLYHWYECRKVSK